MLRKCVHTVLTFKSCSKGYISEIREAVLVLFITCQLHSIAADSGNVLEDEGHNR